MNTIFLIIMAVIYVEAVTELILTGDIFESFREKLYNLSHFTAKLIGCGYCLSVWVSASVAWIIPLGTPLAIIDFIILTFVIHRLSNVYHEAMTRWLNRIPWSLQLHKTETVLLEDSNGSIPGNSEETHQIE